MILDAGKSFMYTYDMMCDAESMVYTTNESIGVNTFARRYILFI